jgi:hypothetical protein
MTPLIALLLAGVIVGGAIIFTTVTAKDKDGTGTLPPPPGDIPPPGDTPPPKQDWLKDIINVITPPDLNKWVGKTAAELPAPQACESFARARNLWKASAVVFCVPRPVAGFDFGLCACVIGYMDAAGRIAAAQYVCPGGICI